MQLSEEALESASKDVIELEKVISKLVLDFEDKHKSVQITIRTRWPNPVQKYSLSKGGGAQIDIRCNQQEDGSIVIGDDCHFFDKDKNMVHIITVED